ncbi:MAG: NAD(P)/FAD-dependent oxidoreductase [Bacteroidaceae bacterium]|nr:NAD(P)/FAD-dependent oxidoreductase [Bacteroidaceae bacterium]
MNVIIIGGGLGGLFTGAILAKEGKTVTIIEKNTTIGGGLQTFERFGETYDTGMHVIAGMHKGNNIRRICDYLGVSDGMKLYDVDDDCTDSIYVACDRKIYNVARGREGFVDSLSGYFPNQRESLKRYVDAMFKIVDEMPLFYLRSASSFIEHSTDFFLSADAFIAKYISDEKLRGVLAYINMLYSGESDITPAFVHAVLSVLYLGGPTRFVDGSDKFADLLADVIKKNGGQIIKSDGVASIQTEDHKITGVTTKSGIRLVADTYVSDIHPCTLLNLFEDPKALPKLYRNRLNDLGNTYSAFTINIKFKPNVFEYINHTGFYISDYDKAWSLADDNDSWPLGFLYMTPPVTRQGKYTNKMIITVPMRWACVEIWENSYLGHRPIEYKVWKEECAKKVLDRMEEIFPSFRDKIEQVNTASPLTIRDYYGVKNGAMCGYAKDYKQLQISMLSVRTKISNLFLTGQNVNLHGFCGVPLTSIRTSEAILGNEYILNKLNEIRD